MLRVKEISLVIYQEFNFGVLNVLVVSCLVLLPAVRDKSTRITLEYSVIIGSHELG